jgi:hypothetical protein
VAGAFPLAQILSSLLIAASTFRARLAHSVLRCKEVDAALSSANIGISERFRIKAAMTDNNIIEP